MRDFVDYLFFTLLGAFLLTVVAAAVVYLPAGMRAHAACLKAGYPKSEVTWDLNVYCLNLDGSVTVKVVPQ